MLVLGEAHRGSIIVLKCVRDQREGFPPLEIPEWMFDSHRCNQMKSTESPWVACAGLLAIKHLLLSSNGIQGT